MENKFAKSSKNERKRRRRSSSGRLHSSTREYLLVEIESRESITTAELVQISGLHENTIRGHLEALYADGYINRSQLPPNGKGRPSIVWAANKTETEDLYKELTNTLLDALLNDKPKPARNAHKAGEKWGAKIAFEISKNSTRTDPRALVIEAMRQQGFNPEDIGEEILLRKCPLISAAHKSDVVCAIHEGMISGIANSSGKKIRAKLTPFEFPGACALRLVAAS
ncbi:MAG: hypothetical protein KF916_06715 [Microbacteriaceae bacterium]|nr:hypothetical protein [Microbacteriaceae bacterium]